MWQRPLLFYLDMNLNLAEQKRHIISQRPPDHICVLLIYKDTCLALAIFMNRKM